MKTTDEVRGTALADGRAAAAGGEWRKAFAALTRADQDTELGPDDLELLGWAAFFSALPDAAVAACQRAFAAVRPTEPRRAGLIAVHITLVHAARGAFSVAGGWLEQAGALLADEPECVEALWLAWARALLAVMGGDLDARLAEVDAIIARAQRLGVTDVEALASLVKVDLLTRRGDEGAAARLLDGMMALAVGGCLGPFATASVFCVTVSATASTGDFRRAWQWTEEIGRCRVRGSADYPGDCRIHRAELLRLRGDWVKAEIEAASVVDELGAWSAGHEAAARYELGQLSLLRGDLEAAAVAFDRCRELGHSGEPGLSRLELASGRPGPAAARIREVLTGGADLFTRCSLLAAAVEILLAAGQLDEADEAARELDELSRGRAPIHQARAAHANGAVALVRQVPSEARRRLLAAVELWRQVPAPYEEARSLELLGLASELQTRDLHLREALDAYTRLGAVVDLARVEAALGRGTGARRVERTFVFTDIEDSTSALARLGDDAWLAVLRRHDALILRLVESHGGEVISSTGDGFFLSFPDPEAALKCSLQVQAELQELRVRIGVHSAVARRDGSGYSGRGIHEAARISALGAGGDIVVSVATLERAAQTYDIRRQQAVELKGLPGTTEVAYLKIHE